MQGGRESRSGCSLADGRSKALPMAGRDCLWKKTSPPNPRQEKFPKALEVQAFLYSFFLL